MAWQNTATEPLLAMEDELRALQQAASDVDDDRSIEDLGRRLDALELEISRTAARTPAGLAVKIRRLWENFDGDPEEWDVNNYQALLDSLERLSAAVEVSNDA